jgi:hypothetical protein
MKTAMPGQLFDARQVPPFLRTSSEPEACSARVVRCQFIGTTQGGDRVFESDKGSLFRESGDGVMLQRVAVDDEFVEGFKPTDPEMHLVGESARDLMACWSRCERRRQEEKTDKDLLDAADELVRCAARFAEALDHDKKLVAALLAAGPAVRNFTGARFRATNAGANHDRYRSELVDRLKVLMARCTTAGNHHQIFRLLAPVMLLLGQH